MHLYLTPVVLAVLAACHTPSVSVTTEPMADGAKQDPGTRPDADKPADKPEDKAAKAKKQHKELRAKQRALAHARVEHQVAAIDRREKAMTVEAGLASSARKLEAARAALALFLEQQKPRELEEHKIRVDRSIHRADHSKDELAELTAMYEADEFAKATKELVLKRGRRSLEMAERELAVAKKELAEFENHTLPRRERELRDKVTDAELERKKAGFEAEKADLQQQLATQKEAETLADLEEEIEDLKREIAKLDKELEGRS